LLQSTNRVLKSRLAKLLRLVCHDTETAPSRGSGRASEAWEAMYSGSAEK